LAAVGIAEEDLSGVVSTGYGRKRVEKRMAAVTEITCHAKGITSVLAGTRVLIDIGGQDSKAIALDGAGNVVDFAMNDKCAAGTGRFLEAMARALQTDITRLGDMDQGAQGDLVLSSMCTVFAESEVVSLIAKGVEINEIVAGLNRAIASRTLSLVKRVSGSPEGLAIAMSGGVARNGGVIRALKKVLNCDITVPKEPDTIGALGAALIALERSGK
jgi:predicted CoA-substrate-specific enzyme activase